MKRHIACDSSFATLRHVLVARLPKAVFGFDSNLATVTAPALFFFGPLLDSACRRGGEDAAARPLVSSRLVWTKYSGEIEASDDDDGMPSGSSQASLARLRIIA